MVLQEEFVEVGQRFVPKPGRNVMPPVIKTTIAGGCFPSWLAHGAKPVFPEPGEGNLVGWRDALFGFVVDNLLQLVLSGALGHLGLVAENHLALFACLLAVLAGDVHIELPDVDFALLAALQHKAGLTSWSHSYVSKNRSWRRYTSLRIIAPRALSCRKASISERRKRS